MASTYKAYLGEGLGPLEWIKKYQIPHPGRVIGRVILHLTMPGVLGWVLGGNNSRLVQARPSSCRIEDRLKVTRVVGVIVTRMAVVRIPATGFVLCPKVAGGQVTSLAPAELPATPMGD